MTKKELEERVKKLKAENAALKEHISRLSCSVNKQFNCDECGGRTYTAESNAQLGKKVKVCPICWHIEEVD